LKYGQHGQDPHFIGYFCNINCELHIGLQLLNTYFFH